MRRIVLSSIQEQLHERYDLFMCCAGFEPRCLSVLKSLPKNKFKGIVVFGYDGMSGRTRENYYSLLKMTKRAEPHTFQQNNPVQTCMEFHKVLGTQKSNAKLLIDISTFSRENLLILSKLLLTSYNCLECSFVYVPSERYANINEVTYENLQSIWLSRGIQNIRSILGFAGEFSPSKKLLLTVLSGFEYERAQFVINTYEPDKVLIGRALSKDSITEDSAKINDFIFTQLKLANKVDDEDTFTFSCHDIKKTGRSINEIISKYSDDYNIVICPMNTKISALAIAGAVCRHSEVQICYAQANQYNTEYYSQEFNHPEVYFFDIAEL